MNTSSAIMLDLETLGTTPGCIVLSIGAVEFNATKILKHFQGFIDPVHSQSLGMHMDASTVMWWLDQPKAAQDAISNGKPEPLDVVLGKFVKAFNWKDKLVWCNGSSFDFPILTAAFKKAGMQQPWAFWNEMDMRTVKNNLGKEAWKKYAVKPTLAHDSLSDAVAQAESLQHLFANAEPIKWAA